MRDKPPYIRRLRVSNSSTAARVRADFRARRESLIAVDDAVAAVVAALERTGRLASTYVLFTSDNGFFQGEHRILKGKYLVYDPSSHVPLLIRGPGIAPGSVSGELVANTDLAPTLLDAAGATADIPVDGRSILPFARDPGLRTRRPILHEGLVPGDIDRDGAPRTHRVPRARFAWQHDAHRRSDGAITIFDNEAFPPIRRFSRALALRLDQRAKTASLAGALTHPRKLLTATQGNQQTLPDGGAIVGWGSQRYLTEFGPAGDVAFSAFLSLGFESYRAYRLPWVGLPLTRPKVAAADEPGAGTDVYSSWNGATEVATWEILAGSSAARLRAVASGPRTGFETKITVPRAPRFVAARAKDAAGRVLSTSHLTRVARPRGSPG